MTAATPGQPQHRKLGLKAGMRVALDRAPAGWALDDPPELVDAGSGPADLVLRFVRRAAELDDPATVTALGERIYPDGALWLAWPRRAGGHTSDVTDNVVRAAVLPLGLVDVKVAALDPDWSALKIVWRRSRRG
jgi:hypothetical protein